MMKLRVPVLEGCEVAGVDGNPVGFVHGVEFVLAGVGCREAGRRRFEQLPDLHDIGGAGPLHTRNGAGEGARIGCRKEGTAANTPHHHAARDQDVDGAADGVAGNAEFLSEIAFRREAAKCHPFAGRNATFECGGNIAGEVLGHRDS